MALSLKQSGNAPALLRASGNIFVSTNLSMDRTFGKTPTLSELEINSGHIFVRVYKFVELPNFLPKNRPALGDHKA